MRENELSFLRLGCIASRNGSSFQAIVEAIRQKELPGEAKIIISNNSSARVLEFARQHNIPARHLSKVTEGDEESLDKAIVEELLSHQVNLLILSGCMFRIREKTLSVYKGRILNSHPALFSSPYKGHEFFGDRVHQAVIDAKEETTGVTIHLVDPEWDHGDVLAEREVRVKPDDTVESLRERVQGVERKLYIEVLKDIVAGNLNLSQYL